MFSNNPGKMNIESEPSSNNASHKMTIEIENNIPFETYSQPIKPPSPSYLRHFGHTLNTFSQANTAMDDLSEFISSVKFSN